MDNEPRKTRQTTTKRVTMKKKDWKVLEDLGEKTGHTAVNLARMILEGWVTRTKVRSENEHSG